LAGYNVVALLHGHDHHAAHYRWPDPQGNPAEVKTLFGEAPPAGLRSYDVFSNGRLCWLFRVSGGQLIAAHHDGKEWTSALSAVKSLARRR